MYCLLHASRKFKGLKTSRWHSGIKRNRSGEGNEEKNKVSIIININLIIREMQVTILIWAQSTFTPSSS